MDCPGSDPPRTAPVGARLGRSCGAAARAGRKVSAFLESTSTKSHHTYDVYIGQIPSLYIEGSQGLPTSAVDAFGSRSGVPHGWWIGLVPRNLVPLLKCCLASSVSLSLTELVISRSIP